MKVISRAIVATGGLAIAVSLAFAAWTATVGRSPAEPPAPAEHSPVAIGATPEPLASSTREGPVYGLPGSASATTFTNQSKVWFHRGAWWALMLEADSGQMRIHQLGRRAEGWVDTGVIVDARTYSRADVLRKGDRLYVVSSGADDRPAHGVRVSRFRYDEASGRYARDANFPITITDSGVEGPNIARTADATWVSYVQAGELVLHRTIGGDLAWADPVVLSVPGARGAVERSAMVAFDDRVAVVWTSTTDDVVRLAIHRDGDPPEEWSSRAFTVPGLSLGEDDLSVALSRSRSTVYAIVRTSLDEAPNPNDLAPQLVLVAFPDVGEAAAHVVSRVDDGHVDPLLLVNEDEGTLHVVAARGGLIYEKRSSVDDIAFASGIGRRLVGLNDIVLRLSHPTSTKQSLSHRSGMLILASDRDAGRYYYGLAGGVRPRQVPPPPTELQLAHDTFDGIPLDSAIGGEWLATEGELAFAVAEAPDGEAAGKLTVVGGLDEATVCRPFPPVDAGRVVVALDVLLSALPADDSGIVAIRGTGGTLTTLSVRDAALRYFNGLVRAAAGTIFAANTWYRVVITIDMEGRDAAVTVQERESGRTVLEASGLAWRSDSASDAGRACVSVPAQPGSALYVDNLRVIASQ